MTSLQFEESLTHYESLVADVTTSVDLPRVVALVDFADVSHQGTDNTEPRDIADCNRGDESSSSSLRDTLSNYQSLVANVQESETEDRSEALHAAPFCQTDRGHGRAHERHADSPFSSIKKARLHKEKCILQKSDATSCCDRKKARPHKEKSTLHQSHVKSCRDRSERAPTPDDVSETVGQTDETGEMLSTVNLVPINDSFNKDKRSVTRPVLNVPTKMLLGAIQKRRFFKGHCKWVSGVDEEVSKMRFNSLRKACMFLRRHNKSPVASINAYRELTLDGQKLSHMILDHSLSRVIENGERAKK